MVKAKAYIYQKQFDGFPKETDLKLVEEELPTVKDGEFLAEAVYLSLDPFMRSWAPRVPLGSTFMAMQVAKVIESKNPNFPVGKHVVAQFGWRTHTISNGQGNPPPRVIPDLGGLPHSLALGILGVSGMTAYFGLLELCQPKPGETVVVTAAAGAVGSTAGQIAKIKGCTVIGVAGSAEKGEWLVNELGFDRFVNYKDADFVRKLKEAAPKGVDCYFDNVGGEIFSQILGQMNEFGRVAMCGAISQYNDSETPKTSAIHFDVINKQLRLEGFIVSRWGSRLSESVVQSVQWVKGGKLKYRETVTEGFENMFRAFVEMLRGGNIGKTIVKV